MNDTHEVTNNATVPPPSTQSTTNEPAIDPRLKRWIEFCEQTANEAVDQNNYEIQFIKNADEMKKARAEKRLMTKLRKREVEQKAVLLAESQNHIKETDRDLASQEHALFDYTSKPTSTVDYLFHEHKALEELRAMERELKEELLRQSIEKRAQKAGDDWPRIQQLSKDPRYDHIPKYYPGEKDLITKAFRGPQTEKPKESYE